MLEIGDYVNYDAGVWTDEERNSIVTGDGRKYTATAGTPSSPGQFGGLSGSRNGTNGWRVLGIYLDRNGTYRDDSDDFYYVSLASADCVESYYATSPDWYTGKNNHIVKISHSSNTDNSIYVRPSWNQYVNEYATEASMLTYSDVYYKLQNLNALEEHDYGDQVTDTFKNTKYWNLFYVDKEYYLGETLYSNGYDSEGTNWVYRNTYWWNNGVGGFHSSISDKLLGIRVKITLSKDVRYIQSGTKTNGGYTYKVWDISW